MTPASNTSEDLGQSPIYIFFRTRMAQYVVPVILAGWLVFTAVAVVIAPDMVMHLNLMALAIAFGIASLMFPGTVLILGIFSLMLNPENFWVVDKWAAEHYPTMEVQSLHKFALIAALIPAFVRHGIRPVMNFGIAAITILAIQTFVLSSTYPGLTPVQTLKSFIGFALPFVFFNLKIPRTWPDKHLTFIAFFAIISVCLGYVAELAQVLNTDGRPWRMVPQEFTGAYRLAGINIPAYLAFYAYISFFVCVYKAIALRQARFYIVGGITLLILIFTGTRTPSLCAIIMAAITILFASGRDLRGSSKFVVTVLGIAFLAGVLALYWPELQARMAVGVTESGNAVNTSGRAGMWTYLLKVWSVNELFGRGLGTGAIALLDVIEREPTFSVAAHNEYLRLLVDGGYVGMAVYIIGLIVLLVREGRYLDKTSGVTITALFISFALYSFTDNTISAPPPIVLFYAVALIMAKGRHNRIAARRV